MNRSRWIALVCVACVAGFVLVPYEMLDFVPATIGPLGPIPETDFSHIARFGAFLIMGTGLTLAFPSHRCAVLLLLLLSIGVLEVAQSIVPGRHGRIEDFAVKASGTLIGAVAATIGRKIALKAAR